MLLRAVCFILMRWEDVALACGGSLQTRKGEKRGESKLDWSGATVGRNVVGDLWRPGTFSLSKERVVSPSSLLAILFFLQWTR